MEIQEAIIQARQLYPLEKVMISSGFGHCFTEKLVKSPFRPDEQKGSFHVIQGENGRFKWKDFGTGDKAGDEIDFIAKLRGLSQKEAREQWFNMAGITWPPPKPKLKKSKKTSEALAKALETLDDARESVKFNWETCCRVFDEEWVSKLAEWRGYRPEFVKWLNKEGLVGVWHDRIALPVHDNQGNVINTHFRDEDNDWLYLGGGRPVTAWEIGEVRDDTKPLVLFESEWDCLAFLNALKVDKMPDMLPPCAVTRSCSATDLVQDLLIGRTRGSIVAFCQNDPPAKEGEKNGNEKWCEGLMAIRKGIQFTAPPEGVKDLNDWVMNGASAVDVLAAVEIAQPKRQSTLTVRNIDELLNMKFDDSDNYLGDRMLAAGRMVSFLGPGGVGKSRMVLQMAICCILGEKFLGIESHARGKKWLIIQTENNNRRLSSDLRSLAKAYDLTDSKLAMVKRCLAIHTVETIDDAYVDLTTEEDYRQVAGLVDDEQPDIVVLDPLNTFTAKDLNSDAEMREVTRLISQAIRTGNPDRCALIIHHSLTGKAGAQKASGWDKASYGRNSKNLLNAVRAQWNLTQVDPDDYTQLMLAGGKNNDGALLPEIGVIFNEETGIYEYDPDFDLDEFRASLEGQNQMKAGIKMPPNVIANMFSGQISGGELSEKLEEHFGASRSACYRAIKEAHEEKYLEVWGRGKRGKIYRKGHKATDISVD
tara:strand:- start:11086 stop:13200 length:2115 start_codon:yes stop_codon:yes gene_type:complete